MKQILTVLLLLTTGSIFSQSTTPVLDQFFTKANQFLSTYVDDNGRVNYEEVSRGEQLQELVDIIATMNLQNASEEETKAFNINAYNLMAIHSVIVEFPISSVRKIRGFFKTPLTIAGKETSLDLFEKSMEPSNDPRLHMILVCAANSCPILRNAAYLPTQLDSQIDKAVRKSMSKTHIVSINDNNSASISKIFEWYKKDFEVQNGVVEFINKYMGTSLIKGATFD